MEEIKGNEIILKKVIEENVCQWVLAGFEEDKCMGVGVGM